jgi:cytoskeleton protein RodZ
MPAVGAYLRELRERQGISIDEIARSTRVLHHYLEALESDDLASLPAPVFAKGFIRAYCQALGVPADEAIRLYEQRTGQIRPRVAERVAERAPERVVERAPERVAERAAERRLAERAPERVTERVTIAPAPVTPPRPRPSLLPPPTVAQQAQVAAVERRDSRSRGAVLISFVLLVVMGAALYAVTMALQSGRDDVNGATATQVATAPEPAPASPEPAPAEPTTPAPAATQHPVGAQQPVAAQPTKPHLQPAPSAVPPTVSAAAVTPPNPSSGTPAQASASASTASPYRLVARTTETTWIRVRTEDGRTTEETIPPNEVREWISNGPFVLTIGNAGGVSLELNGRLVPRLGASGAVISRMVLPPDVQ